MRHALPALGQNLHRRALPSIHQLRRWRRQHGQAQCAVQPVALRSSFINRSRAGHPQGRSGGAANRLPACWRLGLGKRCDHAGQQHA